MKAHFLAVGALASTLVLLAACGTSEPSTGVSPPVADAGRDADAGNALDSGDAADSGKDVDSGDAADSGGACEATTCSASSACNGVPYDQCSPINSVCSCAITCLEGADGGTNCPGGSPCKTSSEGTKYCAAIPAR